MVYVKFASISTFAIIIAKNTSLECASSRGECGIKSLEMLLCRAQVSVFN